MSRPTDIEVSNAIATLRSDYAHTVSEYAASFLDDIKRGNYDCTDLDGARDALHEYVDGCQDVIYTFNAKLVGCFSRYDWESEAEDMGLDHPTAEQIAFICLKGEIWEEVENDLDAHFEAASDEGMTVAHDTGDEES